MGYQLKIISIFLLLVAGCVSEDSSLNQSEKIISSIKENNAPDRRVAIFDIEAEATKEGILLSGESNLPNAVTALKDSFTANRISFVDNIELLPSKTLGHKIYGVVKLSVANLRSEPQHPAELSTQATLGTPLKIFKKDRGWYLVQTPDNYISWLDEGGLQLMTHEEFSYWQHAEKLIYLNPFGFSYKDASENSSTISDLVMGNILEIAGDLGAFYQVKYPDSTMAFISKNEAFPYNEWIKVLQPTENSLLATSFALKGLPYLWGGTSFKAVDCSGFTKTVYFMNGIIIPRDASQQIHIGELVDDNRSFENLLPGDLLFFGRPSTDSLTERVVHVGMWIGNNEFIHASGNVHISSVDSMAENFDLYNYNRYLRTKRILYQNDDNIIYLSNSNIF